MPSRYHPLFDGLWNDEKFDKLPFEGKAFFIYLFGNSRQRPSGIYRVTDAQIGTDTNLPLAKVKKYVRALHERKAVVRDGLWLFVVGYFGRQSKNDKLLNGVLTDISNCTSSSVLKAFGEKYHHYRKWTDDRLATLADRSGDQAQTVRQSGRGPYKRKVSSEQSSTEPKDLQSTPEDPPNWLKPVDDRMQNRMRDEGR